MLREWLEGSPVVWSGSANLFLVRVFFADRMARARLEAILSEYEAKARRDATVGGGGREGWRIVRRRRSGGRRRCLVRREEAKLDWLREARPLCSRLQFRRRGGDGVDVIIGARVEDPRRRRHGGLGRDVVAEALAGGHETTALVRNPAWTALPREVEIVQGDVLDRSVVDRSAGGLGRGDLRARYAKSASAEHTARTGHGEPGRRDERGGCAPAGLRHPTWCRVERVDASLFYREVSAGAGADGARQGTPGAGRARWWPGVGAGAAGTVRQGKPRGSCGSYVRASPREATLCAATSPGSCSSV